MKKTLLLLGLLTVASMADVRASAQEEKPLRLAQTIALPAVEGRIDHLAVDVLAQTDSDETGYREVEDGTFTEAGKVGLWTKADSVTYFDDLKVVTQ